MGEVLKILIGKDTDILGRGKARPALGKRCGAQMLNNGKVLLQQDLLAMCLCTKKNVALDEKTFDSVPGQH